MDIRLHENESAQCKDYYRSGFDRGHMAPNGTETIKSTLREKCPNTDQKKLRIWTLFTLK